jgi:Tol biopolymer transport system component
MYSIAEKTVTILRPADEKLQFSDAGFGPRVNEAVAIVSNRDAAVSRVTQVVVLKPLTSTFRRVTADASIKYKPNFSFDGQKLAYEQSDRDRTWANGSPRATAWDIHTLDVTTGVVDRVTSFCFWGLGRAFLYPGSDDLVFGAAAPMCNYPTAGAPADSKGYLIYKERFAENEIVRLGPNRKALEPWFKNGGHSSFPSVARNGDVLFVSRTNEMDGITKGFFNYDLFLWSDQKLRRLTRLKTALGASALSADGRFAVYVSDPERNHRESLWLYDIEKDTHELIPLAELEPGNEARVRIQVLAEEHAN